MGGGGQACGDRVCTGVETGETVALAGGVAQDARRLTGEPWDRPDVDGRFRCTLTPALPAHGRSMSDRRTPTVRWWVCLGRTWRRCSVQQPLRGSRCPTSTCTWDRKGRVTSRSTQTPPIQTLPARSRGTKPGQSSFGTHAHAGTPATHTVIPSQHSFPLSEFGWPRWEGENYVLWPPWHAHRGLAAIAPLIPSVSAAPI